MALDGVDVYFNLHKRVWSCKSRKTGRVTHHAPVVVTGYGATMVVQEAGRKRVLEEGRKNVHAFARMPHGECYDKPDDWLSYAEGLNGAVRISYNPYKAGYFYHIDTQEPVTDVKSLIMVAPVDCAPQVWAVL